MYRQTVWIKKFQDRLPGYPVGRCVMPWPDRKELALSDHAPDVLPIVPERLRELLGRVERPAVLRELQEQLGDVHRLAHLSGLRGGLRNLEDVLDLTAERPCDPQRQPNARAHPLICDSRDVGEVHTDPTGKVSLGDLVAHQVHVKFSRHRLHVLQLLYADNIYPVGLYVKYFFVKSLTFLLIPYK